MANFGSAGPSSPRTDSGRGFGAPPPTPLRQAVLQASRTFPGAMNQLSSTAGMGLISSSGAGSGSVPAKTTPTLGLVAVKDTKGKGKASPYSTAEDTRLADSFRASSLQRTCIARWKGKHAEQVEWVEACRRADEYALERRRERGSGVGGLRANVTDKDGLSRRAGPMPMGGEKKRRYSSASASVDGPRRIRRRLGTAERAYKAPVVEEALVERLKQNRAENEKRWAPSSFLQTITSSLSSSLPSHIPLPVHRCSVWLSVNPENDGTAIWMERKFGVPESGEWVEAAGGEGVFGIPLSLGKRKGGEIKGEEGYGPVLVVFECTPVEKGEDDIERKMTVLADCARLRDIVKALPQDSFSVPSLLVARWTKPASGGLEADFEQLVNKFTQEGKILAHQVFLLSAEPNDPDKELAATLSRLNVDLEGSKAQFLSVKGAVRLFDNQLNEFVEPALGRCAGTEEFNWNLLAHVIQASIKLLSSIRSRVQILLKLSGDAGELEDLEVESVVDHESMMEVIAAYLERSGLENAQDLQADMESHEMLGRDFPATLLIDRLREHILQRLEALEENSSTNAVHGVLKTDVTMSLKGFEGDVDGLQQRLVEAFVSAITPKRRGSVSASVDSVSAKRRRLSTSASLAGSPPGTSVSLSAFNSPSPSVNGINGYGNGRNTLSPDVSMSSVHLDEEEEGMDEPAKKKVVTAAMLRALTRSVKAQYGPPPGSASAPVPGRSNGPSSTISRASHAHGGSASARWGRLL